MLNVKFCHRKSPTRPKKEIGRISWILCNNKNCIPRQLIKGSLRTTAGCRSNTLWSSLSHSLCGNWGVQHKIIDNLLLSYHCYSPMTQEKTHIQCQALEVKMFPRSSSFNTENIRPEPISPGNKEDPKQPSVPPVTILSWKRFKKKKKTRRVLWVLRALLSLKKTIEILSTLM